MRRYFALLVLTALIGAVLSATPSHAGDAQKDAIPAYVGPPNLYGPYAPEVDPGAWLPPLSTSPERKRFQPVTNYVKGHPWYCLAHHNSVGCGSFQAEWVYIFGNCRQFYGEPCFKQPPAYPYRGLGGLSTVPGLRVLGRDAHDGRGASGCASCGP